MIYAKFSSEFLEKEQNNKLFNLKVLPCRGDSVRVFNKNFYVGDKYFRIDDSNGTIEIVTIKLNIK